MIFQNAKGYPIKVKYQTSFSQWDVIVSKGSKRSNVMIVSFVWLYLIKCVFTCPIFVDSNTKRFLSVLGVFGKYFIFTKTENFINNVTLFWRLSRGSYKLHATIVSSQVGFGDLFVSGRSSRKGYTEIFVAQLTTLSRVRLPVAKNT